jgi:hypothetical protein
MSMSSKSKQPRTTGVVVITMLVLAFPAAALEIEKYDQMSQKERLDYETQVIKSSISLLQRQRRDADAQTVIKLFTGQGDGNKQYLRNIDLLRLADAERAKSGGRRLHVEDALSVTLEDHGITVRPSDLVAAVQQDLKHQKEEAAKKK